MMKVQVCDDINYFQKMNSISNILSLENLLTLTYLCPLSCMIKIVFG